MTDEGEERGSGFDDLFEDLDKFFAPEEQQEGRRRRGAGDKEETPAGEAGADSSGAPNEPAGAGRQGPSPGSPSDDDFLSGDWLPDIEGLDLGDAPPTPPPGSREVAGPAQELRPADPD